MTKAKRRVGRPKSTAAAPSRTAETSEITPDPQALPVSPAKAITKVPELKKSPPKVNHEKPETDQRNTKPWVDIIQGNRNINRGMAIEYVPPQFVNGEEKIVIEDCDVEDEIRYWENAVIIFALGESLSMHAVKGFMEKSWNFVSLPELYFNESGYFIARFKDADDQSKVMEQGPYFIYGKPLFLKYWTMDFELQADLLRVLPLWITLPNLPLHLWGKQSISKITSVLGKPITTDECTARKLRISYARVLVEVDITRPVKDTIKIKDQSGKEWDQKVEYEWRPKYCQTCLRIGHDCAMKKVAVKQPKVWQKKPDAPAVASKAQEKEIVKTTHAPTLDDGIPINLPEEKWTTVTTSKSDKAKKKINFSPTIDMIVQNVFTPLGIGGCPGGESSNSK
ncbi:uncharacterized protein LOC131605554 [Vicia villosa]|uniref:uncharacterized protein LOC131605554 n=1 Tax=Vicia villosa TaxID=3911 RepID=UPI00273C84D0|nr:uncharacterized protein LOC131605554 [Vicia villosa]